MRRISTKGAARSVVRRDLVARILNDRPHCEIGDALEDELPGHHCERLSVDVHEPHTRGRGGDALDEENTLAVCRACHDAAHRHQRLSLSLGALQSGHSGYEQRDPAAKKDPEIRATVEVGARIDDVSNRNDAAEQAKVERALRDAFLAFHRSNGRWPTVEEIAAKRPAGERTHKILGDMILCGLLEIDGNTRALWAEGRLRLTRRGVGAHFNDSVDEQP